MTVLVFASRREDLRDPDTHSFELGVYKKDSYDNFMESLKALPDGYIGSYKKAVIRGVKGPNGVVYKNDDSRFQEYVNQAMEKLKDNSSKLEVDPRFDGIEVDMAALPTYIDKRTGKVAGKIFGVYNPKTRSLTIDIGVIYNDRRFPGIPYPHHEDVIVHELIHHIQNREGAIDKNVRKAGPAKAREIIEGSATDLTEYITGRDQGRVYRESKEKAKRARKRNSPGMVLRGDAPISDFRYQQKNPEYEDLRRAA